MNEGRVQQVDTVKSAKKDPCLESVRLRLENLDVAGFRSAMAIAKLLGQDEVVALLEEEPEVTKMRPVAKVPAPVMNGDEVAAMLRLRRYTYR